MTKGIDLHMHSKVSDDGEFSSEQLVDMVQAAGLSMMAIADHNSVRGVRAALDHAKDVKVIPAIEIDCTYGDINLHVLGYGIDIENPQFDEIEENVYDQEVACSKEKLRLTNLLGFHLVEDDLNTLSSNGVWTGEMFAEALLSKAEYQDHPLLMPYRTGHERSDNPFVNFYWDYYAKGKPCYTEIVYPSLEKTIEMIHQSGGKAVLAHPGNNLKNQFQVLDEMVPLGLDGVEAFSSYHQPEVNEYFYHQAKKLGLMITCGSDFHGKTKPAIHLGGCGNVNVEEIEAGLKANGLI